MSIRVSLLMSLPPLRPLFHVSVLSSPLLLANHYSSSSSSFRESLIDSLNWLETENSSLQHSSLLSVCHNLLSFSSSSSLVMDVRTITFIEKTNDLLNNSSFSSPDAYSTLLATVLHLYTPLARSKWSSSMRRLIYTLADQIHCVLCDSSAEKLISANFLSFSLDFLRLSSFLLLTSPRSRVQYHSLVDIIYRLIGSDVSSYSSLLPSLRSFRSSLSFSRFDHSMEQTIYSLEWAMKSIQQCNGKT